MLTELYIENIAVIEKTNIEFSKGFNVLTGETGAGKSIVIDAISAVLGRRTSRELVRTGASSAFVSATFEDIGEKAKNVLLELGYSLEDNKLLIEREFTLAGKNICRINGRPAAVSVLRDVGQYLINIHGQHESYELMSPELHIGYIDALGSLSDLLSDYRVVYDEYKEVSRILNQKETDDRDRARRADILCFQIDEIEAANLTAGEEEALSSERQVLSNSAKLRELFYSASYYLGGDGSDFPGGLSLVSDACDNIDTASTLVDSVSELSQRLRDCYYELQDIVSDISREGDNLEDDPQRLEEIELRLDLINKLEKKYGSSIEEILAYLEEIKIELEGIKKFAENREKLFEKQSELYAIALKKAQIISEKRIKTAAEFSKSVADKMKLLDMPSAKVEVSHKITDLSENGIDQMEFLVSTNAGEPVKPVAKVASGGELSRMMLSIKTVLSSSDPTDTLIFDEVDTGISGSAARRVGDALKEVSASTQALCVTHLPQIAALADSHYLIRKTESEGRTFTQVNLLDMNGRVEELARIIGGVNVTDAAYDFAKELLGI
ncbi:MAG: DNA repair protein RecN [Ruminococcaceae bacterium]|nr:DNA repair protein RecN [Oscillospiraceae bacterium]